MRFSEYKSTNLKLEMCTVSERGCMKVKFQIPKLPSERRLLIGLLCMIKDKVSDVMTE